MAINGVSQSAVFKRPAENGLAEMGQSDSGQHFESELMVVTMPVSEICHRPAQVEPNARGAQSETQVWSQWFESWTARWRYGVPYLIIFGGDTHPLDNYFRFHQGMRVLNPYPDNAHSGWQRVGIQLCLMLGWSRFASLWHAWSLNHTNLKNFNEQNFRMKTIQWIQRLRELWFVAPAGTPWARPCWWLGYIVSWSRDPKPQRWL